MKLQRLTSTNRSITREAAERARAGAAESHRKVDAQEGTEADRERSLQQEVAAAEARFGAGGEREDQALHSAQALAEELTRLGDAAAQLVKALPGTCHPFGVYEEA